MPQTNAFNSILSPQGSRIADLLQAGRTWFVSENGSDVNYGGVSRATPFATGTKAMSVAEPGDVIVFAPCPVVDGLLVPIEDDFVVDVDNVTLIGLGPVHSAALRGASGAALTINGLNCKTVNLVTNAAEGAAEGVLVHGDGWVDYGSLLQGDVNNAGIAVMYAPSAVVGATASLSKLYGSEIAWAANGVQYNISTSASTEELLKGCWFHNISGTHVGEGGAGSVIAGAIEDCTFGENEDAAAAYFIKLNTGGNTDTGIITRNSFPVAINSGKNLVSTGLTWVCNYMTGGISAAQPS